MRQRTSIRLLVFAVIFVSGCAGAKPKLGFENARYPVSSSHYVSAADGSPVSYPRLERVGTFQAKGRGWAMLYSALPLNKLDFSDELNRQVEAAGGEAVVGLTVKVKSSGVNIFWPLNWIPLYPGTVIAMVEGAIVRDNPGAGPPRALPASGRPSRPEGVRPSRPSRPSRP
ncbi:hypothetical protein ACFL2T_04160 [Elusimicrobiota bacterium]